MAGPTQTVAVPQAPPLDFVLWDGTSAVDSQALARGLLQMGLKNQVLPGDQLSRPVPRGAAKLLQPAGTDGFDISNWLMFRGIFEFPRALFGAPLQNDTAGHAGSIVAASGHGVPGFMFSESLIPFVMSRPVQTSATDLGGSYGNWSYVPHPVWASSRTKVALFSACRQLQGKPQQYYWSQTMRGASPVHMILSYRETGPSAAASAGVNRRFLRHCRNGETLLDAWKKAHVSQNQQRRWAALCHEASVDDKLKDWVHTGRLASQPSPSGTILYFDSDTPHGTAVLPVAPEVDCWLTRRGSSRRLPPWTLCGDGELLDLHVQVLPAGAKLKLEDRIIIAAAQVRPDYFGPFGIKGLFTMEGQEDLVNKGLLRTHRILHDDYPEYSEDTYNLRIRPAEGTPPLDPDERGVTIPIVLGRAQNEHIPLYYFLVGIAGESDGRRYGLKPGSAVIDEFQLAMFRLKWPEGS